jgi:taurine dioxygenase
MSRNEIEIRPIAGACGAELHGVDLSRDLDDGTITEIKQALNDHLVIFFRDQNLTPARHKAFGRRFGTLSIHPHYVSLPEHDEILPILKEPEANKNIGGGWHSDVSFLARPALGSILYALDVPSRGGDTMFANQQSAYAGLSEGMKAMLDGMTAVHSDAILSQPANKKARNVGRSTKLRDEDEAREPVENEHPVVRTHIDSGRKSLFVNGAFTERFSGMTAEESRPLLRYLYAHAVQPEFTCRFRWEKGSVAFWDNRCVQHYALNDYPGERRSMHRVTIDGEQPV